MPFVFTFALDGSTQGRISSPSGSFSERRGSGSSDKGLPKEEKKDEKKDEKKEKPTVAKPAPPQRSGSFTSNSMTPEQRKVGTNTILVLQ